MMGVFLLQLSLVNLTFLSQCGVGYNNNIIIRYLQSLKIPRKIGSTEKPTRKLINH